MTTPIEMTQDELEQAKRYIAGGDDVTFPGLARVGSRLLEHIAALEARTERERERADAAEDSYRDALGERDRWQRLHSDASARADAADVALATEERAHAETRAMHSQMCMVAMEHQRDRDNARDAALEEAAQRMEMWPGLRDNLPAGEYEEASTRAANALRALKSQPAHRFVDAEAKHCDGVMFGWHCDGCHAGRTADEVSP
jgi:hypothetical protein